MADGSGPTEASVLAYLQAHPAAAAPLRSVLAWQSRHPQPFAWYEVRVFAKVLDRLTMDGLLQRLDGGRYVLVDPRAVFQGIVRYEGELRAAQERAAVPSAPIEPPPGAPPNLFSEIIGYDSVKRRIMLALAAKDPADGHVLLYGPPATAKSLFLEGLQALPGAVYRFADGMTRAGMRRYLLDEKPPYLIIDEMEKFREDEDTALLEFMERQRVSQLITGRNRDEAVNIRVFGAANDIRRIRPELASRFDRIQFREYTPEEFRTVSFQYLLKLGVAEPIARLVAEVVSAKTRDIRDARRIGRKSRTVEDARFLLDELGREARV